MEADELLEKIRVLEEGQAELKREIGKLMPYRRAFHGLPPRLRRVVARRLADRHCDWILQSLGQAVHIIGPDGKFLYCDIQDDVISYGGIPDPMSGDRRFSHRIQGQPDADDMQIGRAMRAAKLRDVEATTGCCGTVYHAMWHRSDVAAKVFFKQEYSEEMINTFRQEVSLMKKLRHPNIILFMGAVLSQQRLCIVTEFLPRGSLFRLLRTNIGKLDPRRRVNMAIDIASGMNYLHNFIPTVVHRDLKSPNLLVDKNWNVKVADFGLSRLKLETFLTTKTGKGTPRWMAPEVLRSEPSNEKTSISGRREYSAMEWSSGSLLLRRFPEILSIQCRLCGNICLVEGGVSVNYKDARDDFVNLKMLCWDNETLGEWCIRQDIGTMNRKATRARSLLGMWLLWKHRNDIVFN